MFAYYDDGSGAAALLAFIFILIPVLIITALIGYIISSFLLMRIFDKAGVQGKWRAWVPLYQWLVFAKLGDFSPWVLLGVMLGASVLSQVPVIGWLFVVAQLAVYVVIAWRVGLKLQKEWYFLFLWLIPGLGTLIWLGILAFDSSRWNTAVRPAPWARNFLADKTVWSGIPVQPGGAAPAPAGAYPPPSDDVPPAPPAPPTSA